MDSQERSVFTTNLDVSSYQMLYVKVQVEQKTSFDLAFRRQLACCRSLLAALPGSLVTPAYRNLHLIQLASLRNALPCQFNYLLTKLGLEFLRKEPATPKTFQACLRFTFEALLCPKWNKISRWLIRGDILRNQTAFEACDLEVLVTDSQVYLSLKAGKLKTYPFNVTELAVSPELLQRFILDEKAELTSSNVPDIRLGVTVHVLPTMRQAFVISITRQIPSGCPYKDLPSFVEHWRCTYGLEVPNDPARTYYVNVRFAPNGTIYSYPHWCVHARPPFLLRRYDPGPIMHDFIKEFNDLSLISPLQENTNFPAGWMTTASQASANPRPNHPPSSSSEAPTPYRTVDPKPTLKQQSVFDMLSGLKNKVQSASTPIKSSSSQVHTLMNPPMPLTTSCSDTQTPKKGSPPARLGNTSTVRTREGHTPLKGDAAGYEESTSRKADISQAKRLDPVQSPSSWFQQPSQASSPTLDLLQQLYESASVESAVRKKPAGLPKSLQLSVQPSGPFAGSSLETISLAPSVIMIREDSSAALTPRSNHSFQLSGPDPNSADTAEGFCRTPRLPEESKTSLGGLVYPTQGKTVQGRERTKASSKYFETSLVTRRLTLKPQQPKQVSKIALISTTTASAQSEHTQDGDSKAEGLKGMSGMQELATHLSKEVATIEDLCPSSELDSSYKADDIAEICSSNPNCKVASGQNDVLEANFHEVQKSTTKSSKSLCEPMVTSSIPPFNLSNHSTEQRQCENGNAALVSSEVSINSDVAKPKYVPIFRNPLQNKNLPLAVSQKIIPQFMVKKKAAPVQTSSLSAMTSQKIVPAFQPKPCIPKFSATLAKSLAPAEKIIPTFQTKNLSKASPKVGGGQKMSNIKSLKATTTNEKTPLEATKSLAVKPKATPKMKSSLTKSGNSTTNANQRLSQLQPPSTPDDATCVAELSQVEKGCVEGVAADGSISPVTTSAPQRITIERLGITVYPPKAVVKRTKPDTQESPAAKKPRAPPKVAADVNVEELARMGQLSKVNAATVIAWLKSKGIAVKSKDKRQDLNAKVLQSLGIPVIA